MPTYEKNTTMETCSVCGEEYNRRLGGREFFCESNPHLCLCLCEDCFECAETDASEPFPACDTLDKVDFESLEIWIKNAKFTSEK